MREVGLIDLETEVLCLADQPVQRLVGQPVRRIAASYVAMHTREPGLLQLSAPPGRPYPQAGFEGYAPLIDRERMTGVQHIGVELDVVIGEPVAVDEIAENAGRAQGPDRIPHADEGNGRRRS